MRTLKVPSQWYDQYPVIEFDIRLRGISRIELPIVACVPRVLVTPKCKIVEYLISYEPIHAGESNLDITRHSYYVDEATFIEVKKAVDEWWSKNPEVKAEVNR